MRNAIYCDRAIRRLGVYTQTKIKMEMANVVALKKSSVGTENDLLSKSTHDQHNAYTEYW